MSRLGWLLPMGVVAAGGTPYLLSTTMNDGSADQPPAIIREVDAPPGEELPPVSAKVHSFADVFRFDITPTQIINVWPRVATDVAQPPLSGYRVALVTGTRIDDLAGSLTYFFDDHQRLQRISFYGTTGDWQRLAQFAAQQYGLAQRPSQEPGEWLFTFTRFDNVESVMSITTPEVVTADQPHLRYQVYLDLQRPPNMD